jgi:ketosteroid isomerase-like protein
MAATPSSEQPVIDAVTALMTDYLSAYVRSDKEAFSACFSDEVAYARIGEFLSSRALREERGRHAHYFDRRQGHWSPPASTEICVQPLNDVAALSRVRFRYPPTSTGVQYCNVSLYLCVRLSAGWRVQMILNPTGSGEDVVSSNLTQHEWDMPRWPIFLDG